jgi:hypothetical protein
MFSLPEKYLVTSISLHGLHYLPEIYILTERCTQILFATVETFFLTEKYISRSNIAMYYAQKYLETWIFL